MRFKALAISLLLQMTFLAGQARANLLYCSDLLALPLPVVAQTTDFTCGVACFDSVLRYWRGHSPGEIPLAYALGTMLRGKTDANAIVAAARAYGFFAQEQYGATLQDLYLYLSRGETVIVGWNSGGVGHYSLVRGIGYYHITLMDPWHARTHPGRYKVMSNLEFLASWNNGVWLGQIIRISSLWSSPR